MQRRFVLLAATAVATASACADGSGGLPTRVTSDINADSGGGVFPSTGSIAGYVRDVGGASGQDTLSGTGVPNATVEVAFLGPLPPDTVPPDTVPPDTVPPDTVPPDTVPPDTVPPDTVPPDTVPPDTIPPDTTSPPDTTAPPDTTGSDTLGARAFGLEGALPGSVSDTGGPGGPSFDDVVARLKTDKDGYFQVDLPPGYYAIRALPPRGAAGRQYRPSGWSYPIPLRAGYELMISIVLPRK
jgi:hypothetical protein